MVGEVPHWLPTRRQGPGRRFGAVRTLPYCTALRPPQGRASREVMRVWSAGRNRRRRGGNSPHKSRQSEPSNAPIRRRRIGAGDGTRTRYLNLGKVALCQVSYSRAVRSRVYLRAIERATIAASSPTPHISDDLRLRRKWTPTK